MQKFPKDLLTERLKHKRDDNNLSMLKSASAMLVLITSAFYIQNELAPGLASDHLFNRFYTSLYVIMFLLSSVFYLIFRFGAGFLRDYVINAAGMLFVIFFSMWAAVLAGIDYKVGDQASFYGLSLLAIAVLVRADFLYYTSVYMVSLCTFILVFLLLPGRADGIYFFYVSIYIVISFFFAGVMNRYFKNTLSLQLDLEKKNDELRLLSTAIEQSPASIIITDPHGVIQYTNPTLQRITGYSADELIGAKPSINKSGNTPMSVYKQLWDTILSGNIWKGEFVNKRKNGEMFSESAIIAPVKDDEGRIVNLLGVKEDITARKESDERLRNSEQMLREANAAKDKFFSIIAHDLRNPFTALIGLIDLLRSGSSGMNDSERDGYIGMMHTSVIRAYGLLEDLLVWARSQSGKIPFRPLKFDLKALIEKTEPLIRLNAQQKEIIVALETGVVPCIVFADYDMMKTVLLNLLTNAVKFTPAGGRVTAGCRPVEGGASAFYVRDTGIGIPEDMMPKLFRIDESVSRKGTLDETGNGLGLMLCREFVDKNRGNISVASIAGGGTVFTVTIPSEAPQEEQDLLKSGSE